MNKRNALHTVYVALDENNTNIVTFTEKFDWSREVARELKYYLSFRGCRKVYANLTTNPSVFKVSFTPSHAKLDELLESITIFVSENGGKVYSSFKEALGEDDEDSKKEDAQENLSERD